MDADDVDRLGRQFKREAASIGTLASQLDKSVNAIPAIWRGSDAQCFVAEWAQHRQSLTNAPSRIGEFRQSALNNTADRQATKRGRLGIGCCSRIGQARRFSRSVPAAHNTAPNNTESATNSAPAAAAKVRR